FFITLLLFFFFFQAEDGIRDRNVTGVQTCALPISGRRAAAPSICASFSASRFADGGPSFVGSGSPARRCEAKGRAWDQGRAISGDGVARVRPGPYRVRARRSQVSRTAGT